MKKFLKRVFILLVCLVLLLVGSVAFLFRHEFSSLASLEKQTDKFSTMNYTADYGLDEFLEVGASTDTALAAFIIQKLMKGLPVEIELPDLGCSAFQAQTPDGDMIMGRNFDNPDALYTLVHTKPENGYESISMVNLSYIGYKGEGLMDYALLLAAPYIPLDGINEKGLSIGVLQLMTDPTHQDTGKTDITTTSAIRMVLDKAATVEEAIQLFSQYDMHSSANAPYHFQLADATGDTATIEYIDGEMSVYRETDGSNLCTTNFYLTPGEYFNNGVGQDRYQTLRDGLAAANGVVTEDEGMALLEAASASKIKDGKFTGTLWSCIYNNTDCTLKLCCNLDYNTVYEYSVTWQ